MSLVYASAFTRPSSGRLSQKKYMRGDPKISGFVTKIYLKYSKKFETLAPFKVLPL
jgi:hypothetical protein